MFDVAEKMLSRERDAMRAWLGRRQWTHFVTLALNDSYVSVGRVRDRLYHWDARMNHALIGGKWLKRPDERMQWFAFPEKLGPNPHWHLCAEVLPYQLESLNEDHLLEDAFPHVVNTTWRRLVPGGTTNVQSYLNRGVVDYITKALQRTENYENFIASMQFIRN